MSTLFENLNVSSFNTENVLDMSHKFVYTCQSLDLSHFNTFITNMSYMFVSVILNFT